MNHYTYSLLRKIANDPDYGQLMTGLGMIDPTTSRRYETPQVAADRTGKVPGTSNVSANATARNLAANMRTSLTNPANIVRMNRNAVSGGSTKRYDGGINDLGLAALDLHNSYTPDQRKAFAKLPDNYKRTWWNKLLGTGYRDLLMKDYGTAWQDASTMCNGFVAQALKQATNSPVMTNPETGRTYTVAEMNKMLHDSEPRKINGYTFTPVSWDKAKTHPGAIVIDPYHIGIRVRNGENYGTLNASSAKGLDIHPTWGDPEYADENRPFRYYVVSH